MCTRTTTSLLCGMMVVMATGCGSRIRHSHLNVVTDDDRTARDGKIASRIESFPVEYVWRGGTRIMGASLHQTGCGLTLKGRIRADRRTMISASRVVKVEAVNSDEQIAWSAFATIDHKHHVRRCRGQSGTFATTIASIAGVDHFHIGVIVKKDKDVPLASTCAPEVNSSHS